MYIINIYNILVFIYFFVYGIIDYFFSSRFNSISLDVLIYSLFLLVLPLFVLNVIFHYKININYVLSINFLKNEILKIINRKIIYILCIISIIFNFFVLGSGYISPIYITSESEIYYVTKLYPFINKLNFLLIIILLTLFLSKYRKNFDLLFLLILTLFFIMDGRRAFIQIFITFLLFYSKNRKIFFYNLCKSSIPFILVFLAYSSFNLILRNGLNQTVLSDFLLLDFSLIKSNLEERWSLLYYHYLTVEANLFSDKFFSGNLILTELKNSIPFPFKQDNYIDTDIMMEHILNFGSFDYPSNIFTFGYADIGIFGVCYPIIGFLIPSLLVYNLRKSSLLFSISCVYLIWYIFNVESQPVAVFLLIRDLIIFNLFFYFFKFQFTLFKK